MIQGIGSGGFEKFSRADRTHNSIDNVNRNDRKGFSQLSGRRDGVKDQRTFGEIFNGLEKITRGNKYGGFGIGG